MRNIGRNSLFVNLPKVLNFSLLAGTVTINDFFVEGLSNRLLLGTLTCFKRMVI